MFIVRALVQLLQVNVIVSDAYANILAYILVYRNSLVSEHRKYQSALSKIYTCQGNQIERNNRTFNNSRWDEKKGHQTFWFQLLDYAQNAWEKVEYKGDITNIDSLQSLGQLQHSEPFRRGI